MTHNAPFTAFLDTVGDGTGVTNAIGDFSLTPTEFKFVRPAGDQGDLFVNSLVIHLQSQMKINASAYGGGITPLTNGIEIFFKDSSDVMLRDFTSPIPIKTNSDWSRLGAKTSIEPYAGGDNFFKVSFKAIEPTLPLFIPPEHKLGLLLADDFTNLINHTFFIEGIFK